MSSRISRLLLPALGVAAVIVSASAGAAGLPDKVREAVRERMEEKSAPQSQPAPAPQQRSDDRRSSAGPQRPQASAPKPPPAASVRSDRGPAASRSDGESRNAGGSRGNDSARGNGSARGNDSPRESRRYETPASRPPETSGPRSLQDQVRDRVASEVPGADDRGRNDRDRDRNWGRDGRDRDRDRYRPPTVVHVLPGGYRDYYWNGDRYYFSGGYWYRPYGSSYISIGVPYGLFVGSLPGYYSSFWYGGTRYFYADDTYYTYEPVRRGYVVARSPYDDEYEDEDYEDRALDEDLYIYPAKGQSEQQQADDRYECHRWAADQTRYDPIDDEYDPDLREDYLRAMTACLTGRGYSVK